VHNIRILLIALASVLFGSLGSANVVVRPCFGHPFIFPDRIVFTSVDRTRLIALDKHGGLQWEVGFSERVDPQRLDESAVVVQTGRQVLRVDVKDGKKTMLLTLPAFQAYVMDADLRYSFSVDTRPGHRDIQFLAFGRSTPLWHVSNVDSIEFVTPKTVVGLATVRKTYPNSSFTVTSATLNGYDRGNGTLRWSLPLAGSPPDAVRSVGVGNLLAVINGAFGSTLLVVDPEMGEVLSRRTGQYLDLSDHGTGLAVLESADAPGEATLFFCDLPACTPKTRLHLSAKEILRFRLYGDYVITAGIYDAACFSLSDGRKLWQRGQLEWSLPFDDEMIITDYDRSTNSSRIVSINLRTGVHTVLFAKTVTKHDERAFRPW